MTNEILYAYTLAECELLMNEKPTKRNLFAIIQSLLPVITLAVIIYFAVSYIGEDNIEVAVQRFGVWAPIVFIILKASTVVLAPLGSLPFYLISPALFGLVPSYSYLTVADILGYSLVFFIGRKFGRRIVQKLLYKTDAATIDSWLGKLNSWTTFAYARIICFSFPELPSYVVSLTNLPFFQYIAVSIPLILLTNLVFISAGGALSNKMLLLIIVVGVIVITLILGITRLITKIQNGTLSSVTQPVNTEDE